jgi:hypothetical protein
MKIYLFKLSFYDITERIVKIIVQLYSSQMRRSQTAGVATKWLEQFAYIKIIFR